MPKQLFFKILIGFWLITVLIAGTIVALPAIIEYQKTPGTEQLTRHQALANRLAESSNLQTALTKAQHRFRLKQPRTRHSKSGRQPALFIVDDNNISFDRLALPRDINLAIIRHQDNPESRSFHLKRSIVFGPYAFRHQGVPYQLYVRDFHSRRHNRFLATVSENRWLLLVLVILVSGISCGFLAWHITRPINSLEKTASRLAQGDLTARAEPLTLSHRDEIGRLAHSFNNMASSVEQMLKDQQRLLSDISHELRTPLTRLQLALAISRRQDGESTQTQRIEQEAESIDKMLQQLLVLSRFRLHENQEFESVGVNFLLGDILDNAIFEAREYNKEIVSQLAPDRPIDVQFEPLASAIENVIRNAIKYANKNISLITEIKNSDLKITISDDGPGVEPRHLANLFRPFYRVSESRQRSSGGTGLGLAIASEAIARHQGKINANNLAQGGLEVIITLPLKQTAL